ncbi:MAG: hypothetical protein CM15mV131_160 [uncultured marine virus]|nr:MAG: hypothetical protein CM15mV131_160 [uncultured marine virus]
MVRSCSYNKSIDADEVVRTNAKGEILDLLNPLQGKFALKDYAQSFKQTQESQKVYQDNFTIV